MSAKWILLITVSIFGSAFFGIFLSTIIFDGPDPDSEKPLENESIEKDTTPNTKSNFKPITSSSTSTELKETVTTSSLTGVQ